MREIVTKHKYPRAAPEVLWTMAWYASDVCIRLQPQIIRHNLSLTHAVHCNRGSFPTSLLAYNVSFFKSMTGYGEEYRS